MNRSFVQQKSTNFKEENPLEKVNIANMLFKFI